MVSEKNWQTAWMRSKNNPLLFVTDVLCAIPEPWQAEALEAVGKHDRVSIRSGHGVGKTTFESWLILWFLLTHQDCKIPVAANSQDQLRDTIWPEIGKWHRQLPDALKAMIDVQAERVVVVQNPEGAFAVRRTASKDSPEVAIPTASASVVSSRRLMMRRSFLLNLFFQRLAGTSALLSTIPCGVWTSLASVTTARRLPSDKRTSCWSQWRAGTLPT